MAGTTVVCVFADRLKTAQEILWPSKKGLLEIKLSGDNDKRTGAENERAAG